MNILFIRHGATAGNLERRYVGRTDEPLCDAGRAQLSSRAYPPASRVFVSPMRRCVETARLLFPDAPLTLVDGFRECDFGAFELLNHAELNGRADYQAWLDSGGTLPFPGGESRASFTRRCVSAFDGIAPLLMDDAAIVAHGGTLMAVLSARALPVRDYYDYQVKNGGGFLTQWDGKALRVIDVV